MTELREQIPPESNKVCAHVAEPEDNDISNEDDPQVLSQGERHIYLLYLRSL
jgi:hypothetical protein